MRENDFEEKMRGWKSLPIMVNPYFLTLRMRLAFAVSRLWILLMSLRSEVLRGIHSPLEPAMGCEQRTRTCNEDDLQNCVYRVLKLDHISKSKATPTSLFNYIQIQRRSSMSLFYVSYTSCLSICSTTLPFSASLCTLDESFLSEEDFEREDDVLEDIALNTLRLEALD